MPPLPLQNAQHFFIGNGLFQINGRYNHGDDRKGGSYDRGIDGGSHGQSEDVDSLIEHQCKREAKNIFNISRWSTCSRLQKSESSQKQAAAPTMRKVVTDKAENSTNADLPMGAISPHRILAVRAKK